jgi:hypothetical protein
VNKACGSDGCDASCGECDPSETCSKNQCLCLPDCVAKQCGDNGCGGQCGQCQPSFKCVGSVCECAPNCAGKSCGDDGCGGDCGQCDVKESCVLGNCVCTPDCQDKECGNDGCGDNCGVCKAGQKCTTLSACKQINTATCPPEGPFGINVGDTMVDVELKDCDGKSYSLHDLCSYDGTWIFGYADW